MSTAVATLLWIGETIRNQYRITVFTPPSKELTMAKKKSRIKEVVETVESWVGIGPKATKKTANKAAKKSPPKTAKKGKKAVSKKTSKKKK